MKTLALVVALGALAFTSLPVQAAPPSGWTDDYAKAVEKAKTEKKNILLDFTGSDWCGFCMSLDKEVFDKAKFKSWARENVVLVQVDFPRSKKLSDKLKQQNDELKGKYAQGKGYPTVVIVDPEGKVLAQKTGYKPGSGPDAYLEAIKIPAATAAPAQ